jgi:hypothetical protein
MRFLAALYSNLAFAACEMSEQTGSASKTKRPPLPPQGSRSLNSSPVTSNQNLLLSLIFALRPSAKPYLNTIATERTISL